MIDLHSHILPGLDDGASDLGTALEMARLCVDQGVECLACTPHILPGLYQNSGPKIRIATNEFQQHLDAASIPLRLVSGADNHIIPNFVDKLRQGHLLTLADTRYVLVEPPHHVAPPQLEKLFFDILAAGYVPILTHPERLTWIEANYAKIQRLQERGVWMQVTSGSLLGRFGKRARYWAERMISEGLVHILATDAHDTKKRPPDLLKGLAVAARLIGVHEAEDLVEKHPKIVLFNKSLKSCTLSQERDGGDRLRGSQNYVQMHTVSRRRNFVSRLRQIFA